MVAASIDRGIVGGHDQGSASAGMEVDQQIENSRTRHGVQVAGRLVGEEQRRVDDQRPRNRDPLLLTTGQLRRQRITAVAQAYLFKQLERSTLQCFPGLLGKQRRCHIVSCRQRGQQVKSLEHESHLAAIPDQFPRRQFVELRIPTLKVPEVRMSIPPMTCSSVDFPDPDGPVIATSDPAATSMST